MSELDQLLSQKTWRIIDQTTFGYNFDALQSFAMDDTLCQSVAEGEAPPTLRSWVHVQTVVLGIQDSRLPNLMDGVEYLKDNGYRVIVRNSGGLAVVLDEGVLNLSLVLSEREKKIDINSGYDAMYQLVQQLLQQYNAEIVAKEVEGSYCPGSYDLSINGKKFAGISQRRVRGGVAVQIYLCVTGSGSERATLIREFYRKAAGAGDALPSQFPKVRPETMASLSELLGQPITIQQLLFELYRTLQKHSESIIQSLLTVSELNLLQLNYERVKERNHKALES